MSMQSVVILRSGRNPFELCLTIGLFLLSAYSLIGGTPSVSLDHALEHWQRILWSAQGLVGAAISLAGIYWKPMLMGLRIERIGMLLLSAGSISYVTVICFVSTFNRSGFVVTMGLAIAFGALLRARQISQDLDAWLEANRLPQDDA